MTSSFGVQKPGLGGRTLLVGLLVLVSTGLVCWTTASVAVTFDLVSVAGFSTAFFMTRLLTIRLPQGDEVYAVMVVALFALATANIGTVVIASLIAGAVELAARYSQSSKAATQARAIDIVRSTCVLGLLAPLQPHLRRLITVGDQGDSMVWAVLIVGVIYSLIDVLTVTLLQRPANGRAIVRNIASLQRSLITMYLVHLAMAAVAVRLYPVAGAWVFPIALLLTLILQNSFNLYLRIRRGYGETISTLAHAAELDRPQDSGHARRVSDLAVAVGRKMGLSSRELERIGYAGLLHDIGRMGDSEGNPESKHEDRGASIVASVPFLADVAPLIQAGSGEGDERAPLGAELVRTCSRYDRLRSEHGAMAALAVLDDEAGGLNDRVLEALREAVQNQLNRAAKTS